MKLQFTRYKLTGKFYDIEYLTIEEQGYVDVRQLAIERYKDKWDGYITVHEIQTDGFEQPMRLITKEELNPRQLTTFTRDGY